MDENNAALEMENESIIDDDWGDIDLSDIVDDAETGESTDEESAEVPTEAGESIGEEEAVKAEAPQEQEKTEDLFSLKHLDEVKQVNRDEVISLAQKGLNYDHIREERDGARSQLAEYENFLKELAEPQGLSVAQLMDNVRAQSIINKEKQAGREMDMQTALERVQFAKEKKAFENKTAQEQQTKAVADEAAEKRRQGFVEFAKERPDVNIQQISKDVWDMVAKGDSLLTAYAKWENKQLRTEIEALKQNSKNQTKSTGSRQSAGKTSAETEFERLWYNGE